MAGKGGRTIDPNTMRALLARSGNKCAFPGCPAAIVDANNNYIAQLCHINSVSHKEQRYDPTLSSDYLSSYENLMFMCYKHHIETNDVSIYTVAVMKKMKYEHEQKYVQHPFHLDMSHVFRIRKENEEYWANVEKSIEENTLKELLVDVDTGANYDHLNEKILESIHALESLFEVFSDEERQKYWEVFNLGFPNHLNVIRVYLDHMKIKYLETFVEANPQDMAAKAQLDQLRKDFLNDSTQNYLAD